MLSFVQISAGSRVVTAIIQSMGVVTGGSVRNNKLQEAALCHGHEYRRVRNGVKGVAIFDLFVYVVAP